MSENYQELMDKVSEDINKAIDKMYPPAIPDNHKWECPFCHTVKTGVSAVLSGKIRYAPATKSCDCPQFQADVEAKKLMEQSKQLTAIKQALYSIPEWVSFDVSWPASVKGQKSLITTKSRLEAWYLSICLNEDNVARGIVLSGEHGAGKTTLTMAISRALKTVRTQDANGYGGVFVFREREVGGYIFNNQLMQETIELSKKCEILVIDDFGTYKSTVPSVQEALQQTYCNILDTRLEAKGRRKFTLISTNDSYLELKSQLFQGLFSRLNRLLGNNLDGVEKNFIRLTEVYDYFTRKQKGVK